MSIIIKNLDMPIGCQKCKFFRKHMFGNGLDYSYSCILGAKNFPMPWIVQMEERASDCPIEPLEQEPKTGHWGRKTKVDAYDIAGVKTWGIKCQCDRCSFTTIVVEGFGYYKYCPNCGCRMESEE